MDNQQSQEQAVECRRSNRTIILFSKMKSAMADLSAGNPSSCFTGSGAYGLVSGLQPIGALLPLGGL